MAARFDSSVDLRLMPSFVALAEELHFSRAAQRLRLAQPALSQQIVRLERQLGVRLFDRPPRPVALTAAGRALLERVGPGLALLEQGVAESRAAAGARPEALAVGHLSSFAARLVPLVVAALRERHPELVLSLHAAGLPEQLAALRGGRVQVGLIHTNPDLPLAITDLRAVTIATGPRMLVMPAGHPLATAGGRVSLAEAAEEPFVLPSGDAQSGYRAGVEGACRRHGFTPSAAALANDTGVMLDLVAAGVGVALMPWIAIAALPPGVAARPVAGERCALVALTTEPAPPTVATLIDAARAAAGHAGP